MVPSVKFVSHNIGLLSKKKNGDRFFSQKKDHPGGSKGGFGKRPYFFPICFSETFPYDKKSPIRPLGILRKAHFCMAGEKKLQ